MTKVQSILLLAKIAEFLNTKDTLAKNHVCVAMWQLVQAVPLAPVASLEGTKEITMQQITPIAKNVRLDFTLKIKMKIRARNVPLDTTVRI
jgi:hypothetical protein